MNRLRPLRILAVGTTLAVAVVTPTAHAAGPSRPTTASLRAAGVHYATEQHACAAPRPGHAACFAIRRVPASKATAGARPYTVTPDVATGPAGGYTPSDIGGAYSFSVAHGAGQTVAIVDAFDDPSVASDLSAFDSQYGLHQETPSTFEVVNQAGAASPLPTSDAGWAGEETLDVQAVRGLCHECRIILVEANSSAITDLAAAANEAAVLGATVISNSYGDPESDPLITPQIAADYNHPRVVLTAAAGEDGWNSWDVANNAVASSDEPNFPASSPTVVAVGGTSLYLNADGSYGGETVWNANGLSDTNGMNASRGLGASGGGCSTVSPATPWQKAVAGWAATGCGNNRLVSDISAVGDPMTGYDVFQTFGATTPGWETLGGTSLSAPVIAAMYADAGGAHGTPYPSLDLYGHVSSDRASLHDVVIGGNGFCDNDSTTHCANASGGNPNTVGEGLLDCAFAATGTTVLSTTGACDASPGYDGPSGVGTPHGVGALTPLSLAVRISDTARSRTRFAFSARVTEPTRGGSKNLVYSWSFGDGAKSSAVAPAHTFHGTGKHRVSLVVTDSFGQTGRGARNVTVKPKHRPKHKHH
jgi:hypothetical protein